MSPYIDVAISVYGKPFQTALTLASLLKHSGQHIDRIFFQEELIQPQSSGVAPALTHVLACFPDRHFVHYCPERYLGWHPTDRSQLKDPAFRRSIRYQRAWEDTDKDLLFITHNDCVYDADVIGGMRDTMARYPCTGIGIVGQCWNCPAAMADVCNGDIRRHYKPSFAEVKAMLDAHPGPRTKLEMIDETDPAPLPECRLTEFACMISLAASRAQVMPVGDIVPFGFMGLDTGTEWFRSLVLQGHDFLNWHEGFRHAPFSSGHCGHGADLSIGEYDLSETATRQYLDLHYPAIAAQLAAPHPVPFDPP